MFRLFASVDSWR